MTFLFLLLLLAVPLAIVFSGIAVSAPVYRGPVSDHFDGRSFINPNGVKAQGLRSVFKWMATRKRKPWKGNGNGHVGKRPLAQSNDAIRITFVNHSTFLIQLPGLNILTDPVWSKRASPFRWIGPKRMRPPGLKMEDLPKIDVILLSHNHYDHLDIDTMRTLSGAHHPRIVTPLGVRQFLENSHIGKATDLDWWERLDLNDHVSITAVPAQHFSGRGMLDRDATLWCGYVITTPAGNIYFAGDTGYNELTFKEIGNRFQPIRVALIPIGAYMPEWFMSPIHVSPQDAVRIHMDTRPEKSIATHFGTFALADEGPDDPVNDLRTALTATNIPADDFLVLAEGEPLIIEGPPK